MSNRQFLHTLRAVLHALTEKVGPRVGSMCGPHLLCESSENCSKSISFFHVYVYTVLVFYYCHAIIHIITVLMNANVDSELVISENFPKGWESAQTIK